MGSNAAATTYWQNALVHVQAHYCHSSLGSKIKISTLSVNHISGTKLTASVASAQAMESSNSARLQGADLMVYMVKFMFSKKATKMDKIFTVDLTLRSKCQIGGEDFVNFRGLLFKKTRTLKNNFENLFVKI